MKSKEEIKLKIKQIEKDHRSVLTGSLATVFINAPRALEQLSWESQLKALHWVLGTKYRSKLKGVDR